jgi:curved DNA-binding protein CbpA
MDGRAAAAVLGISDRADITEIRSAFRARVKVTHPDLGGDPIAFGVALDAFTVLCNRRAATTDEAREEASAPALAATHGFVGFDGSPVHRFGQYSGKGSHRRSFADELRVAMAREASARRR